VYDLNDERDRDDFKRELMRGNDYLEYTKKILAAGKLQSVRSGNYVGQTAPYGYRKIRVQGDGRTYYTLEPIPEQAEVVKRIFEMYRAGLGITRIAQQLNREHIPTQKGGKWDPETLPRMLQNVHYLGKVKWNARKEVIRIEEGRAIKSRPNAEEYLIFEGKHPAIISQELWDAVQERRGKIPKNPNAKNLTNPLAGLMWCSCGRAMTRRAYKDKEGKDRAAPRFHCNDRRHCGSASAKAEDIMAEVVKVLEGAVEDFEVRIRSGEDNSVDIHRQMVERLERKLESLKELEVKQWDEKLKGLMPPHIFDKLNPQTVAEIEEVHHALVEAREAMPEPINLQERVVTFKAALEAIRDPDAPVREVNKLLKACIERIDYHRERYSVVGVPKDVPETPIQLDFTLRI
jgi:hypothetical protein